MSKLKGVNDKNKKTSPDKDNSQNITNSKLKGMGEKSAPDKDNSQKLTNSKLKGMSEKNGVKATRSKLIIDKPTKKDSLVDTEIIASKTNINSKLRFDVKKNSRYSDVNLDDLTIGKNKKAKLIFKVEQRKNGDTLVFNLAENKRFLPTKYHKIRFDNNTTILMTDSDVIALKKQVKAKQKLYKTHKKELKVLEKNGNISNSRLYNIDNASKLQEFSTPKLEIANKSNLSNKSQLSIKLYNKHNAKIPYDILQLKKYNLDFNKRSFQFVYDKANFKNKSMRENFYQQSFRGNFKQRSTRANYNQDVSKKRLILTQEKTKLTEEKTIVKKADIVRTKAKYRKFIKKRFAQALAKKYNGKEDEREETLTQSVQSKTRKIKQHFFQILVNNINKMARAKLELIKQAVKKLIISLLPYIFVLFITVTGLLLTFVIGITIMSNLFSASITTYSSEEDDMIEVDDIFTDKENSLIEFIENIETEYPDYDYYDLTGVDLSEIDHNPYELTALLTALLGEYTPESASEEIARIFELMYVLEFEEVEGEEYPPLTDDDGDQLYDEDDNPLYGTETVPTLTLVVTLTVTPISEIALLILTEAEYEHYLYLIEYSGNHEGLFEGGVSETYSISTMSVTTSNTGGGVTSHNMILNEDFARTVKIGEQFIGQPYVWGGSSPETGFDCSGFISYILNQSGVASFPRTTAQGLYNMSTPIENGQQQAGDLVFFQGTYNTPNTVTHVGYYVGNGVMLHCGNPIGYVNINNSAYVKNFYGFGRIN